MNVYVKALLLSLLCSAQLFAAPDCFQKYNVTLINKSGGDADISKTNGICGASRKTEIPNNGSLRVVITKRGAELSVKAGPEDGKSRRSIKFFSKHHRSHSPSVTLNSKGFVAEGFSQKMITFPVKIENQSGGIAKIVETCDTTGRRTAIADGKSAKITVKPSSYIVVEYGPEKQKTRAKVIFAEQTGDQPSVTFVKRGFISRGVHGRDLHMQTHRAPIMRMHRTRKAKKEEKAQQATRKGSRRRRRIRNS